MSRSGRLICSEHPDYAAKHLPCADEFHLDRRNRFTVEPGNLSDRTLLAIEELKQPSLMRWKQAESPFEKFEAATNVKIELEVGALSNKSLINRIQIIGRVASPPVVLNSIVNDLH